MRKGPRNPPRFPGSPYTCLRMATRVVRVQNIIEHKNPATTHREAVKRLVNAWYKLTGEDFSDLFGVEKEMSAAPNSTRESSSDNQAGGKV